MFDLAVNDVNESRDWQYNARLDLWWSMKNLIFRQVMLTEMIFVPSIQNARMFTRVYLLFQHRSSMNSFSYFRRRYARQTLATIDGLSTDLNNYQFLYIFKLSQIQCSAVDNVGNCSYQLRIRDDTDYREDIKTHVLRSYDSMWYSYVIVSHEKSRIY